MHFETCRGQQQLATAEIDMFAVTLCLQAAYPLRAGDASGGADRDLDGDLGDDFL